MKWTAQVRHVMMKDIRHEWIPLAAFVVVVLLATTASVTGTPLTSAAEWSALVVILGMFVVAALVQSDSPIRTDAFWATRPLYASAVFAAKIVLILAVVVGLPLVGQFLAIRANGVPNRFVPSLLATAASSYFIWLLGALTIAALTKDLRTFIVGGIVVLVTMVVCFNASPLRNLPLPTTSWSKGLIGTGAATGVLMFAARLYRTHDGRRRSWVIGLGAVACLVASDSRPTRRDVPNAPASIQHARLNVEVIEDPTGSSRNVLRLRFHVSGATRGERYALRAHAASLYLHNGTRISVPLTTESRASTMIWSGDEDAIMYRDDTSSPPIDIVLAGDDAGRLDTLQWMGSPHAAPFYEDAVARLSAGQHIASLAGIDSVAVDGYFDVFQFHVIGSIPLTERSSAAFDDTRVQLIRANLQPSSDLWFEAYSSTVYRAGEQGGVGSSFGDLDSPDLSLVNDSRNQGISMERRSTQSGGGSFVLPGTDVRQSTGQYVMRPAPAGSQTFVIDDAWIAGAHVRISQWRLLGQYPVGTACVFGNNTAAASSARSCIQRSAVAKVPSPMIDSSHPGLRSVQR